MRTARTCVVSMLVLGVALAALLPAHAQPLPADAASVATEAASRAAPLRRPPRAKPAGEQPYLYKGTASGDNLWAIAGAVVGPAGLSPAIDRNEVMVAIFRANPEAFPEGNMHRIQRGLDLTVPSRADIAREDRAQAATLVAQHRRAYADRRLTAEPLYPLDGAASAAAAAKAAASSALSASAAASSAEAPQEGLPTWLLALGFIVAAGLAAVGLRAVSRRPVLFDPLVEPLPADGPAEELDAGAEAARDQQRADAAAASLYQEELSPPEPAVTDTPEPAPLPADDPARVAALGQALADAYAEIDRPQEAQAWRAKGAPAG